MLRITLIFLVTAICVWSAPADCTDATLTDYLGLPAEGCRLGTRVISAFELLPLTAGSAQIDTGAIDIHPTSTGLTGSLLFTLNASAAGGDILESIFKLNVAPDLSVPQIVSLTLNEPSATQDGLVLGTSELCSAGLLGGFCAGSSDFLITSHNSVTSFPTASSTTGPGSFDVGQDFVIDAGPTGSASLTSAQLTFTAVPEPGTATVLMTGLAAILLLRRRRAQ